MLNLIQIMDCDPNILPIIQFVRRGLFPIIQIGIPIILIIMGTIDLGKAVMSSDDKEIKGATSKLIKRAIAAVAVFFVATVVSLLMGMFAKTDVKEGTSDWATCWEEAR